VAVVVSLRDHPGLNFWRAWPPVWVAPGRCMVGEAGTFKSSLLHPQMPTRLFIRMEHDGQGFMGCLALKDRVFCRQLHEMLVAQAGRPIQEIGALDLSHLM
jgi:hypothetical protein